MTMDSACLKLILVMCGCGVWMWRWWKRLNTW